VKLTRYCLIAFRQFTHRFIVWFADLKPLRKFRSSDIQHLLAMRFFATVALTILNINTCLADYPLNQTCSPPQSQGGNGYCGPAFCDSIVNKLPACAFTQVKQDYPLLISKIGTKTCTQSTDPRCSSAALKALVFGNGIKAAYCNDAFLVILSDGTSGFSNYLGSIKNPPGSFFSNGSMCVTRHADATYLVSKIPLFPTLLSTSDTTNNLNTKAFPNGVGEGDAAWMGLKGVVYPMPSRGDFIL
jgi:hypothetical protein